MFPFVIACYDTGYKWVWMDRNFEAAWRTVRPKDFGWYCYDVIIHGPTQVEFVVYDIANSFSGGIGAEIGRFKADVDAALTKDPIHAEAYRKVKWARQVELDRAEEALLEHRVQVLLNDLPLS